MRFLTAFSRRRLKAIPASPLAWEIEPEVPIESAPMPESVEAPHADAEAMPAATHEFPEVVAPVASIEMFEPTGADALPVEVGGFDLANEEIDDEIREIFLQEFDEEIANLDQLLPAWRMTLRRRSSSAGTSVKRS